MNRYYVLYRDNEMKPLDQPRGFECNANDTESAEEKCLQTIPHADIIWVYQCRHDNDTFDYAIEDYYSA